jgi:hypothetical protein
VTFPDRYLLVRAASLYIAVVLSVAVWVWRRPGTRAVSAAVLASLWNLPALLLLHVAAAHFGWWQFEARGGLPRACPWAVSLGSVWARFPRLHCLRIRSARFSSRSRPSSHALSCSGDSAGPAWLGEAAGCSASCYPARSSSLTLRDEHLRTRGLQMLAFAGFLVFVLPAIAIDGSGSGG